MCHCPHQPQHNANQYDDHTDQPQDRYPKNESNQHEDCSKNDHYLTLLFVKLRGVTRLVFRGAFDTLDAVNGAHRDSISAGADTVNLTALTTVKMRPTVRSRLPLNPTP